MYIRIFYFSTLTAGQVYVLLAEFNDCAHHCSDKTLKLEGIRFDILILEFIQVLNSIKGVVFVLDILNKCSSILILDKKMCYTGNMYRHMVK